MTTFLGPPNEEANMLLPAVIDNRARLEPDRLFCVLINLDKEAGVTTSRCHAATTPTQSTNVPGGLKRLSKRVLLMSVKISDEAQLKLLETTECRVLLVATNLPAISTSFNRLSLQGNLRIIPFEGVEHWIGQSKVPEYPFLATLESEPNRPFAILHTSGSTGIPEPIVYTFGALTTYRTWLDPEATISGEQRVTVDRWKNKVHYVPFPTSHMTGLLIATALNVYWNMTPILGSSALFTTPALVATIHKLDICDASILPPSLLEAMAKNPEYLEGLRKLDHVIWCGSAFSSSIISNKISSVVPIYAAYGTTEAGPLPLVLKDQEYHEYMTFSPLVGAQWPTKDLMSKHPTKEGMWKYRGRTDDIIVLLNGVNINPLLMEGILMSHPKVVAALLTGTGKVKAAWLIEVVHPPQNEEETTSLVEELWPTVEKANDATYRTEGKVSKDNIIFTSKDKPMLRAGKGSVQRKFTLVEFRLELDALYE
ncbi:putative nrps-like enzyme protein [Botrytis fragariae]|uniref:Putative nrps-like enzyme protein n=1 Tax=Botrytis fragariae TaxID=1964551 RepID=A0A8H6EI01_9HELO|nr:putative nrps-like enzyme protein [Botrytis fragariae]KAF5872926.1 putative nrps-like enzyme protein [Botrytis fragariae]